MLVQRWQAQVFPSQAEFISLLENEGLECEVETFPAGTLIANHIHPFDEIRIIIEGELRYSVSGNQILLRRGDRVAIPANTRHSIENFSDADCVSLFGKKL